MKVIVSVVVCTLNRARLLDVLLKSLIKQDADKSKFEIIIVDNNSSDGTKKLVDEYISVNPKFRIKYIREDKIGLSNARNKGVEVSRGEYVSFLDDDAYVDLSWLGKIYEYTGVTDKETYCLGGPIISYYLTPKPLWFKDEYASDCNKGNKSRFLDRGESFSGSNMVWKKDKLGELGGFARNVGMKGSVLSVGEETALFEKIWKINSSRNVFKYYSDLKVYHLVPAEKMTVNYRLKRWFAQGQSKMVRLRFGGTLWQYIYSLEMLGYFIVSVLMMIITFFRYRRIENFLVERTGPFFYFAGYFSFFFGFKIKIKNE